MSMPGRGREDEKRRKGDEKMRRGEWRV